MPLTKKLNLFFSKCNCKRSFVKRQASGTSSDNEWQRVVQRVTTNDNEWYNEWQRVITSGTTSDNEWQLVTTSDNKWQRVTKTDDEWERVIKQMKTNKTE